MDDTISRAEPVVERTPAMSERPVVAVDVVIFTLLNNDLGVLLVRRVSQPYQGMWALPGGSVQMAESLEAAALRVME